MKRQKTYGDETVGVLRDQFLQPQELFLLAYLSKFDRQKNQAWNDMEFAEFSFEISGEDEESQLDFE